MAGDAAGSCQVVVGIGLNVTMSKNAGAEIDQAWTDLFSIRADSAQKVTSAELLANILNHLRPTCQLDQHGGVSSDFQIAQVNWTHSDYTRCVLPASWNPPMLPFFRSPRSFFTPLGARARSNGVVLPVGQGMAYTV